MLRKSLFLLSIVIISSCKKNESQNAENVEIGKIENHRVTLSQARTIAIAQSVYPQSVGKGISKKDIRGQGLSSAPIITNKINPAKSIKNSFSYTEGETNPTFYIINYNEGGFAIISADDRIVPILATSDENTFPIDNISSLNYGILNWLHGRHQIAKAVRAKNIKQSNVVKSSWQEITVKSNAVSDGKNIASFPECLEEGQRFFDLEEYGPLLTTAWDQMDGNSLLPYANCSQPANGYVHTGCTAVAMAQIMKYWGYPTTYSWSTMTTPNPGLMYNLGFYLKMEYGCFVPTYIHSSGLYPGSSSNGGASVAYSGDIEDVFKASPFNYSSADYGNYNRNAITSDIRNGRPVILSAQNTSSSGGDGRHSWVADGVRYYITYECHLGDPPQGRGLPPSGSGFYWTEISGSYETFHMNWGMYPNVDGWFLYNDFTPDIYNYNGSMKMINNILP